MDDSLGGAAIIEVVLKYNPEWSHEPGFCGKLVCPLGGGVVLIPTFTSPGSELFANT